MRKGVVAGAAIFLLAAAGCHTGSPRTLSIPTTRDYQALPQASLEQAEQAVAEARRAGAGHNAPYELFSAEEYLRTARQAKDDDVERDYAALALQMAEAALKKGPAMESVTPVGDLSNEAGVRAVFDETLTRLQSLDKDKAIAVAPVLYARATADLSRTELLLGERRGWKEAAKLLPGVSADLDTIAWQDSDVDKVPDLKDMDPRNPEDVDGFQDEDGAPEADNDADGVPDVADREPMAPETQNRWHDADGAVDTYPTLEPVYFAEGSTVLSPDARGYLQGIKLLLDEWPGLKLHIKGYSDGIHSDTYSMDLSQRRAQEVQRTLMLLGVTGDRLATSFQGQAETPTTNIGNRVELVLE